MQPRSWIAAALFAALAGAAAFGWAAAGVIERAAATRAEAAAHAAAGPWARVAADGVRLRLTGAAPDGGALDAALAAAAAAVPFAQIAADAQVAAAAPVEKPLVDLLRDAGGVTISGFAPDAESLQRLASATGARASSPLARTLDAPPPPGWGTLEQAAATAVEALAVGRVSLSGEGLVVRGLPASEQARIAIERMARALRAAGRSVALDLSAPPSAEGARVLDVELVAGVARLRACAPPDAAAAGALTTALGGLPGPGARCAAPAGGRADAAWSAAAEAGIAALAAAGGGRFRLEDRAALFAPDADRAGGRAAASVARLSAALPDGFALRVEGGAAAPSAPAAAPGAVWLRARASPAVVLLTGAAPDLATRAAVLSYAAAAFGAERVHDGMALAAGPAPEGWRTAALAGLDALSQLDSGEVVAADGAVTLHGVAREPLAARDAHAALGPAAARGWRAGSRVTVDLPARAAEALLAPAACAERLGAQVAAEPIVFAPASAEIDGGNAALLDALAATLRRCAGGAVEIGGHTDSQGSAGYNLALSQARAEAVRAALIARGAAPASLTARGYGQAQPVADNDTEEGRALNRRIAFSAPEQAG